MHQLCIYAVDDEPAHGPNAYFVLQGFYETEVITQLAAIGLRVHAVIKTNAFKQLANGNVCDSYVFYATILLVYSVCVSIKFGWGQSLNGTILKLSALRVQSS